MSRHRNWSVILKLEGIQRRVTKIIKRSKKNYSYTERVEKLKLMTSLERRMRGNLIETFKITNGISKIGKHFFDISPQTGNLPSRQIFKTNSTNQLDLFPNRIIYF